MPKMFSLGLFFFPITVPNEASVCGSPNFEPNALPDAALCSLPTSAIRQAGWTGVRRPFQGRWSVAPRWVCHRQCTSQDEQTPNKLTHRTPQSLIKVQISCKENTLKGHFRRAAMGDTRWLSEENGANAAVSSTKLSFLDRPGSKVTICAGREAGRRCAAGKLNANEESEPGNLVRADRDWTRLRGKLSRRISRRCCYFKGFSRPGGDYLHRRF